MNIIRSVGHFELLALLLLSAAVEGRANTAGVTVPGSASYPNNGMRRIGKLTFSRTVYRGLYNALYDPSTGCGYFATANGINANPGHVIKVDLNGPLSVEVGAADCQLGEYNLNSGVMDPANGCAYFGTTSVSPGRIIKIALGAGASAPAYLGSIALNPGEDTVAGAVADLANGYGYFAVNTPTNCVIVKVTLPPGTNLPARVAALQLPASDRPLRRGVIDAAKRLRLFRLGHRRDEPAFRREDRPRRRHQRAVTRGHHHARRRRTRAVLGGD